MKFTTRTVQALLSAATLAFSTAAASLANGDYVIYNRVLDEAGQQLAITYQGNGEYVTAEPLVYSSQQIVSQNVPSPRCLVQSFITSLR